MGKKRKLQITIVTVISIVLIHSCTSSLFIVKGQRNSIKTEQNVNADSTSVSINNQK